MFCRTVDESVLKFLRLIDQSDGGISLLKDVKMDMPYQRWFHPASPFTQEGLETQHSFTKPFERPEMKELFALLIGKVIYQSTPLGE